MHPASYFCEFFCSIVLRDVVTRCTRLEVSETGDVADPRISLFLNEDSLADVEGTVLLDTRQSRQDLKRISRSL